MSQWCEWREDGPPFKCVRCDQTANNKSSRKTCRVRQPSTEDRPRPVQMPPDRSEQVKAHGPEAVEAWSLIRQTQSLAAEATKWVLAGCPLRSEDEQQAIEAICAACPKRVAIESGIACGICGCAVARKDPGEHSLKIKMATTHCPDKPALW